MRYLILFSLLVLFILPVSGQSLTGAWYGRADVVLPGNTNNYLTELIIRQKGNEVEGIFGYYFKDAYQSFFVRGTYNPSTREVIINKMPILFHGASTRDGIECPMHFEGKLMVSQVSNTLQGSFITEPKYKYTCPELKVNLSLDLEKKNTDSLLKNTTAGQRFWKPQPEDFIVVGSERPTSAVLSAQIDRVPPTVGPVTTTRSLEQDLVSAFKKRKKTYSQDIFLETDSVRISFYDNGDIDGDSISVFVNDYPVLVDRYLSERAINLYLSFDQTTDLNEISMLAQNLGKFPPNTALMIITDGINRYEIYLSSTLTQNATIRLRRKR